MTTVFIWNNNQIRYRVAKLTGYAPGTKEIDGHVSINIDDNFVPIVDQQWGLDQFTNNTDSYVSWIPKHLRRGEGIDLTAKKLSGIGNWNFFADLCLEQYAPDHIIRIANPSPNAIEKMKVEWRKHLQEEEGRGDSYNFYRKNCSRVTSRVLRAGWNKGAGNIKYGQLVSGLWTPLMVKRLALDLKGGPGMNVPPFILTWDRFVEGLVARKTIAPLTGAYLRTYKKRASNRGSSQAESRFTFEKKKGRGPWAMQKEEENFSVECLIYFELLASGQSEDFALKVLASFFKGSHNLPNKTIALNMAKHELSFAKKLETEGRQKLTYSKRKGPKQAP